MMPPLLSAKALKKNYLIGKNNNITAVNDLSLEIFPGETLGLVGESGSGKSTLGRCLLRLEEVTSGDVFFEGVNLRNFDQKRMFQFRRQAQMIFQDPYASLNPRMTINEIIAEPFRIHSIFCEHEINEEVMRLLDLVGLSRSTQSKFPHALSGGQQQRVGIARAIALKPKLLVCDEPVSSLDVSVQAQIMNLLKDLQKEFHLTYLFIAHDLTMVSYISTRVAVMHSGKIVEQGYTKELFTNPQHPYTKALLIYSRMEPSGGIAKIRHDLLK